MCCPDADSPFAHDPIPAYGGLPVPDLPPAPPVKKSRTPLIAAIAAAAVILVATAALFLLRGSNPRAYLAECTGRTIAAYGEDELGLSGLFASAREGMTREQLTLGFGAGFPQDELEDMAGQLGMDARELAQSSATLTLESDMAGRRLGLEASAELGSFHVGSALLFLDDDLFSFSSPELTLGNTYGIHTETLAEDWNSSVFASSGNILPGDISFNLFDALTPSKSGEGLPKLDEATITGLGEAWKAFDKAITARKSGSDDLDVIGRNVKCVNYTMNIPGDALKTFCGDTLDLLAQDSQFRASMDSALAPLQTYYGASYGMDEIFGFYRAAVDSLEGDVQLIFYIADKAMVGLDALAAFQEDDDTITAHLNLRFGDEKALQNAFYADLYLEDGSGDNLELTILSKGDHKLSDGKYSDKTTITIAENDELSGALTLSTSYDTKAPSDNFSFSLLVEEEGEALGTLSAAGTVSMDKAAKTFSADLQDVSLTADGERVPCPALSYSIEPISAMTLQPGEAALLLSMDQDELSGVMMQFFIGLIGIETRFSETLQ